MDITDYFEQLTLFEGDDKATDLHLSVEVDRYPVANRFRKFGALVLQDALDIDPDEVARLLEDVRELEDRADYDQLTGLYRRDRLVPKVRERLLVMERVNQQLPEDARYGYGLAFIDLDDFKPVNDAFGHDAGDEVLRAVGDRLRTQIRASDMAFRLGGDEFVLYFDLLQQQHHEALLRKMTSIRGALGQDIVLSDDRSVRIGTSIGMHLVSSGNMTASELGILGTLRTVDGAMYAAKRDGKNNIVVV